MKIKSRDKRDKYYRRAKSDGYRARSAYKLIHLADEYNLFSTNQFGLTTKNVVDLCAAPGSWSQVLSRALLKQPDSSNVRAQSKPASASSSPNTTSKSSTSIKKDESIRDGNETSRENDFPSDIKNAPANASSIDAAAHSTLSNPTKMNLMKSNKKVIAVDIQEMAPIDGVNIIKGDITSKSTCDKILDLLEGEQAQLVLCDGAPEVSGLHALDEYLQSQLLHSALGIIVSVLEPGGSFVGKVFKTENLSLLCTQFRIFFKDVIIAKPPSSRSNSIESFIVCRGFRYPSAPNNLGNIIAIGATADSIARTNVSHSLASDPRDRTTSAASTPLSGKHSIDIIDRNRAISLSTPVSLGTGKDRDDSLSIRAIGGTSSSKARSASVYSTPPSFYSHGPNSPSGSGNASMLLSSFISNGDLSAFDNSDSPYWTSPQSQNELNNSEASCSDRTSKRKPLVYSNSSKRSFAANVNSPNSASSSAAPSPVLPALAHHLQWKRKIEERRGRKSSLSSFGRLSIGDEEEAGATNISHGLQNFDSEQSASSSRSISPKTLSSRKMVDPRTGNRIRLTSVNANDVENSNSINEENEISDEEDDGTEEEEVEAITNQHEMALDFTVIGTPKTSDGSG